jgi:hypothetical protein
MRMNVIPEGSVKEASVRVCLYPGWGLFFFAITEHEHVKGGRGYA